ncbi:hypothetical protein ABKA04_001812 [Annulohypoxylon sp. FPYF3050]
MSDGSLYYAEPPPGQVRTPVNPPTRRGSLMAAGISTTIIAGIALSLRLYTRVYMLKKKLEPDDYIDHGLTYHVWDILQDTYHIGERLLPKRQKVSVILLFATGIVVCCVALKRVTYIPTLEASEDYDWDAVPDMILCFIEVNLGIVCASVPVVRPFFSRLLPALLAHGRKSSGTLSSGPESGRVIDTVEQKNIERQNLKRRNHGQDESYDMSTLSDASRCLDSQDEESRLWPPPETIKDRGFVKFPRDV